MSRNAVGLIISVLMVIIPLWLVSFLMTHFSAEHWARFPTFMTGAFFIFAGLGGSIFFAVELEWDQEWDLEE